MALREDRRGSSLLLAIFVVSLLGLFIVTLLGLIHRETLGSKARGDRLKAFYCAEAGLRKIEWDIIAAGYQWPYGSSTKTLSGDMGAGGTGKYDATAVKTGNSNGVVRVEAGSTGLSGEVKSLIKVRLGIYGAGSGGPRLAVESWEEIRK